MPSRVTAWVNQYHRPQDTRCLRRAARYCYTMAIPYTVKALLPVLSQRCVRRPWSSIRLATFGPSTTGNPILCVGEDHALVDPEDVSELIGPPPLQWLVDLFGPCDLPWRQVRPSRILLTHVRPETIPVVDNLLIEVLPVISPWAAHWILLQAIDERLRNGRFICRHVRGKVGIRHVKDYEIYEVDCGGYRW